MKKLTPIIYVFVLALILSFIPACYQEPLEPILPEELFDACKVGNIDEVKRLIEQGVDVNARDSNGWTPLVFAAGSGHAEIADLLIDNNADVTSQTNEGRNALMYAAAYFGHTDIARILIDNDADIDAIDNKGLTALMLAARRGHIDTAGLLLNNGADIDTKCNDGMTALMYATDNGHTDIVDLLKESGAIE